jgi:integrase
MKLTDVTLIAYGKRSRSKKPVYYARWLGSDGKEVRRSTRATSEHAALEWVQLNLLTLDVSTATLSEYFPKVLKDHLEQSKRTRGKPVSAVHERNLNNDLDKYVLKDELANLKVSTLKRGDIEAFLLKLSKKVTASTTNRILKLLKLLLKHAAENGDIARDPSSAIKYTKAQERQRSKWSQGELQDLFPADPLKTGNYFPWTDDQCYTAGVLLAATRMRRGEIVALEWDSVFLDDDPPMVHVKSAIKGDRQIGLPKWDRTRFTPIFSNWVFGDDRAVLALREWKKSKLRSLKYVFHTNGQHWAVEWINHIFLAAMKNVKLNRDRGVGKRLLDVHSLRHTLNSLLLDHGVPPQIVRQYIGHSDDAVQNRYTHVDRYSIKQAAQTFGFSSTIPTKKNRA